MLLSAVSHPAPRRLRPLLTTALALGWVPAASAQLLWEDGFEGPSLDPAWQVTTQNVSSWSAGFAGGGWHLEEVQGAQSNAWATLVMRRDLACQDELLVTAELGWSGSGNPVMQQAMLFLRDADDTLLAYGGYDDSWVAQRGEWFGCVGGNCVSQGYGNQPDTGTLTLQATLHQGQIALHLDGTPFGGGPVDTPVSTLELVFTHFEYPTSTFGNLAVHSLRLESPLVAPAVSIQADSSLVLQWPAQHCNPVRIYQAPALDSPWPAGYTLLAEAPAGTDHWPLPAPAPDSQAVYRLTRVLE